MPKLPWPASPLSAPRAGEVRRLGRGTTLYRVYRAGGRHATAWNAMRFYGPTTARFDPHPEPPGMHDRGVLYVAGSIPTAVAEAFGLTRVIERTRDKPFVVGFELARAVRLLDLTSAWPTRAGASQAVSSGRKAVTRAWARLIYEEMPDIDGLLYNSSMSGSRRRGSDPVLHGVAVALFDRGTGALPPNPVLHLPLNHPGLDAGLGDIANRYGYELID